jgi:hypothetical protein
MGALEVPGTGQLVRMRFPQWVVATIKQMRQLADELAAVRLPGRIIARLTSVNDDLTASRTSQTGFSQTRPSYPRSTSGIPARCRVGLPFLLGDSAPARSS